jgi:hypothetical protein
MTVQTVDGWDATGANLHLAPATGQAAGYTTGSGGVPWSTSQKLAHPGFVQIDQSPIVAQIAVEPDFFDLENGAVTDAEIATFVMRGQAAFNAHIRPGQRWPGVYCSASRVTTVVNELIKGGITSCPLGVADYNFDHAVAQQTVANATGPFPIVWYQYSDQGGGGAYDLDVFSVPWLAHVSGKVDPVPPTPTPVPSVQSGWLWCHKCQSLFFGPGATTSVCPAGTHHDGTKSYNYSLPYNLPVTP